jgi:hypothetical protein
MPVSASSAPACSIASGKSPTASATRSASASVSSGASQRSSAVDSAGVNSRTATVAAMPRQAGLREVISTRPGPCGNHRDKARGSSALSNTSNRRSRWASAPSNRATPTPAGVVTSVSSRARASSANRSGINPGSSAGTHQAMSNSS